ncbi:autotransporter outer membrane beta-barrel domain-containing protein [Tardiphaga sp. 709]|uniref:autotransporter family protein n=1 Tax=Tardiphaga sp. 709 TaxID=3076039 RepID=UPI0028E68D18|nr:autotransporter outer membrane beta-barrel domain-containing protein [Tardiphaga sp. 709]WNV09578.1 autotransporter outer membrane beta-barrel domain-containing protein [Tardiphaga sp. 709]
MRECIGFATIGPQPDDMRHESPDRTRRSAPDSHGTRLLRSLLASASAMVLMALSAGSAAAQSWTGTSSSDWTAGTNWSGGVVPIAGSVTIDTTSPNRTVLGVTGPAAGTTGNISVGVNTGSTGSLTIQNGSTLTSSGASLVIGVAGGSNGTVTVTGAGSQWITSGSQINVGASGNGTLNIQNGAAVVAQSGVSLGTFAGGTGTLNINGGSRLETNNLARVAVGTGQVNFDNAILRARINNNFFISGFSPGNLNIAAGGLTVDTQAFTVGAGSGFSGVGGLTKIGAGTLNLRVSSDYTGPTVIQAGTLALASTGSISASSRVVVDATFNVSGITATSTSIQSLAGSGAVALGAKNLTITDAKNDVFAGVISGTGGLTISGGMQTLSGVNTYTGGTTVSGGTLSVNGSVCGAMNVLAGGTLQGTGTVCDTSNAGIVAPGNSIGTLTVAGNYTGNGGTLQIESVLGGDASPTDRLVVTGNTAGSTNVRVINLGGTGAQTVEGIKIIDVGGASNGAFSLLGDYVIQGQQAVVGGAYAYTLQKNGISTPTDGDWYLRSSLINPPPPMSAMPLYQPGVPLYENYAQVLLGMNELPTMQQRVGNRYWGGSDAMARAGVAPAAGEPSPTPTAFWGRIEGGQSDLQPSTTTGSTYKADQLKVQAGLDGLLMENERGRLIVGLTGQYGLTTANIASVFGNGRIRVEGAGVGGTLTWFGDNGFYVDGQAQSMFYRSDLSSVLAGSMTHGNEGVGYAFSAEAGKRFFVGNGWSLTPQAQLSYSKAEFDRFTDRFGAPVSLRDGDSLLGRAGLALNHQKTWNDGAGIVRSDIYGIGNLRYEFLDGTRVDVAGTGFASAQDRLWGSVGGGGTYSWANGRYAVFGEVSYSASLEDAAANHSYKGTGGFRIVW